jgi:hypothetical protein
MTKKIKNESIHVEGICLYDRKNIEKNQRQDSSSQKALVGITKIGKESEARVFP